VVLTLEVVDGVHFIECPHRSYFVSSCLIESEGIILIDAGRTESPKDAIYPYIKSMGREPSEISHLVLTHAHWDHCAGATQIRKDTGCRIGVHDLEAPFLKDQKLVSKVLSERFPSLHFNEMTDFVGLNPDFIFRGGELLDFDGIILKVIFTPGHSQGSCCILIDSNNVCIAGDSAQGMGEERPLIFHNITDYIDSMRSLSLEKIEVLLNGHPFPPFKKGVLRKAEVYEHFRNSQICAEKLIDGVIEVLTTSEKLMSVSEISQSLKDSRPITIGCILEDLERRGEAKRSIGENGYYLWINAQKG
jgi:glyoxylase-like metal-dependent hydrolase (beta-lactamase superfamily II)